jgi:hypothetical protein
MANNGNSNLKKVWGFFLNRCGQRGESWGWDRQLRTCEHIRNYANVNAEFEIRISKSIPETARFEQCVSHLPWDGVVPKFRILGASKLRVSSRDSQVENN